LVSFLVASGYWSIAQEAGSSHPLKKQIATPAASIPEAPPPFDVVSIKPTSSNIKDFGALGYWNGAYRAQGWSLEGIILDAYFSPTMRRVVRIGGITSWMQSERFDIVAKVDDITATRLESATNQQKDAIIQPMVQKMLADRFGLVIHRAPIEVQGYALTVAKKGAKLTPSRPGDPVPQGFRNMSDGGKVRMVRKDRALPEFDYLNVSIATFIDHLSTMRSILLVDQTGLKGTYNFSLLPLEDAPSAGDENVQRDPRLENTIPWDLARLGLQIKRIQVKTETIVIDSIHRPTPN
jgi:uncharacterized protein (TIGR03435 family)